MGASHSHDLKRLEDIQHYFDTKEQQILQQLFERITSTADKNSQYGIDHESLEKLWGHLSSDAYSGLLRLLSHAEHIYKEDFTHIPPMPLALNTKGHQDKASLLPFMEATYCCLRGTTEQKAMALYVFWLQNSSKSLKDWILPIIQTEIQQYAQSSKKYQISGKHGISDDFLERILSGSPSDLAPKLDYQSIVISDREAYLKWFSDNKYIQNIVENYFTRLFLKSLDVATGGLESRWSIGGSQIDGLAVADAVANVANSSLPSPVLPGPSKPTPDRISLLRPPRFLGKRAHLLNIEQIWFLHYHIPKTHTEKWGLLYTSGRDGHAWHPFASAICKKGSTLLLFKDKQGHIFGCFAAEEWVTKPSFYGSSQNLVFSLHPHLGVYTSSGYNNNHQYFEQGTQTLPNGLGMGGQLEYFGLFISADFQHGHSRANPLSSTYQSPTIASAQEFEVDVVEALQVREPECDEDEIENCKQQSAAHRAQVMDFLEMAGVTMYSKQLGVQAGEEADDDDD